MTSKVLRAGFHVQVRISKHWLDVFRTCYGPVNRAFAALDAEQAAALEAGILDLLKKANMDGSGSLVIPGAYLEVVIERS